MRSQIRVHHGNRFALSVAEEVCTSPGHIHNPLFLCGNKGCGKTDLMHAIGRTIRLNSPHLRIQYVVGASNDYTDWSHLMEQYDVLLVDDADELMNSERGHYQMLQLIERMRSTGKQLVIGSVKRLFPDHDSISGHSNTVTMSAEMEFHYSEGFQGETNPATDPTWNELMARFRSKVSDTQYNTWFSTLEAHWSSDKVTLHTSNELHRDWMMLRYQGIVEQELTDVFGADAPAVEWAVRRTGIN